MHEFTNFLIHLANYWFLTLPILAWFIVATILRLRALREDASARARALEAAEEEDVLARRTLDFAFVGPPPSERDEYHQMPAAVVPDGPLPGMDGITPEADETFATEAGHPEAPASPPAAPDLPAPDLGPYAGEPDPDSLPRRSLSSFDEPAGGLAASGPPPDDRSVDPELEVPSEPPPAPLHLDENMQRFEEIRNEVHYGNRAVLDARDEFMDEEAIHEAEAALADDPENAKLLDWLAFMYYTHDQLDRATEAYKKLISRQPDSPDLFFFLANCFYKVNLLPEAIYCWDRSLGLGPSERVQERAQASLESAVGLTKQWEAYGIHQPITDRFVHFLVQQDAEAGGPIPASDPTWQPAGLETAYPEAVAGGDAEAASAAEDTADPGTPTADPAEPSPDAALDQATTDAVFAREAASLQASGAPMDAALEPAPGDAQASDPSAATDLDAAAEEPLQEEDEDEDAAAEAAAHAAALAASQVVDAPDVTETLSMVEESPDDEIAAAAEALLEGDDAGGEPVASSPPPGSDIGRLLAEGEDPSARAPSLDSILMRAPGVDAPPSVLEDAPLDTQALLDEAAAAASSAAGASEAAPSEDQGDQEAAPEVRFDEADALQSAFDEIFVPEGEDQEGSLPPAEAPAADEPTVSQIFDNADLDLEEALAAGGAAAHLERASSEDPGEAQAGLQPDLQPEPGPQPEAELELDAEAEAEVEPEPATADEPETEHAAAAEPETEHAAAVEPEAVPVPTPEAGPSFAVDAPDIGPASPPSGPPAGLEAPLRVHLEAAPETARETRIRSLLQVEAARKNATEPKALELLDHEDPFVRVQTTYALGLTQPSALPTLVEGGDPAVRRAAALTALVKGQAVGIPPALRALSEDPEWAPVHLAAAVASLTPETLPELLDPLGSGSADLEGASLLWEAVLQALPESEEVAGLELALAVGGEAGAQGVARHLGLPALEAPADLDRGALKAGDEAVADQLSSSHRVPGSLWKLVARDPETMAATLLAELEDEWSEDRDLSPADLPEQRRLQHAALTLLAAREAPLDPRSSTSALALRLFSLLWHDPAGSSAPEEAGGRAPLLSLEEPEAAPPSWSDPEAAAAELARALLGAGVGQPEAGWPLRTEAWALQWALLRGEAPSALVAQGSPEAWTALELLGGHEVADQLPANLDGVAPGLAALRGVSEGATEVPAQVAVVVAEPIVARPRPTPRGASGLRFTSTRPGSGYSWGR